jgi:ribosomal protein S18 acetylase RimI-like enzyme
MQIIRARRGDASTLSAIAWAAKGLWGYPPHWMEQWRSQLSITPEFVSKNPTFTAIRDRQIVGFHALLPTPDGWRLEHLWVLPERTRQGIGRLLFLQATGEARARGASSLTIEADPHAEPFYQQMGATRIGSTTSAIDGLARELPLVIFDLTKSARPSHDC